MPKIKYVIAQYNINEDRMYTATFYECEHDDYSMQEWEVKHAELVEAGVHISDGMAPLEKG